LQRSRDFTTLKERSIQNAREREVGENHKQKRDREKRKRKRRRKERGHTR
jgi:hypothetical protein